MKKYLFIVLMIRNGEYEYYSKTVHEVPADTALMAYADECAAEFYESQPEHRQAADGGYYTNGGEVFTKVDRWHEITEAEYAVLHRFI